MGTLLLAIRRLEERHAVVEMDPAVLEEAFQQLTRTACWQPSEGVTLSHGAQRASFEGTSATCLNVMSINPCDDFTVHYSQHTAAGADTHNGCIYIGFVAPSSFSSTQNMTHNDRAYMFYPARGRLWGAGAVGTEYCSRFSGVKGTLRCVVDRAANTIMFYTNGKPRRVAWENVEAGPLHAIVQFVFSGFSVEFD